MKKLFENWEKFKNEEETELDIASADENPVNIMRKVLEEVQDMALRLVEIEKELKDKYQEGESSYHPGKDFDIAARRLSDSGDWQSLGSKINRWIENEVSLPIVARNVKDKLEK